jgi:uncharacterized membrane protein
MRLSWRDAAATVLVLAAAAVMLSVVNGWNWLLIGDARAGAVAVFILGFAASVIGGGPTWFMAALRPREISSRGKALSLLSAALGLLALVLLVVDLFVNDLALLVWATLALVAIWVVATIHHAGEARPQHTVLGL